VGVSVIGVLAAPVLSTFYAAGYRADPDKFALTVQLTAMVFPYVLFAGLAALLTGLLNAVGSFLLPAFSPALLNVALIAAPFTLVPVAMQLGYDSLLGLGVASLAGGALQVLVQIPAARARGVWQWPQLSLGDPDVRRSMALMAPLLLGTGVYQANILLARLLASFLPDGSQSSLYFAQRLVEIPQGMFAVAVASAALPSLARLHSQGAHEETLRAMRHSVKLTSFVALPCSAALIALAEPTVAVVFGRGAFGAEDIARTASALAWLSAGVLPIAAIQPVIRIYYAYGETRGPVLASAINLVVFAGSSIALAPYLAHGAIACGTSIAGAMQLTFLLLRLRPLAKQRGLSGIGLGELSASIARHLVASVVLAAVALPIAAHGDWSRGGNDIRNLVVYTGAVLASGVAFLLAGYALKTPELAQIAGALRRRTRSS